eukprot:m.59765 g.59765  ORF g.59765 m.59765 type:complete len:98 (+) comp11271_c1_seq2:157-450(+)
MGAEQSSNFANNENSIAKNIDDVVNVVRVKKSRGVYQRLGSSKNGVREPLMDQSNLSNDDFDCDIKPSKTNLAYAAGEVKIKAFSSEGNRHITNDLL